MTFYLTTIVTFVLMGCTTAEWEGEKKLIAQQITSSKTKTTARPNKKWKSYKNQGIYLRHVIEEPLGSYTTKRKEIRSEIPDITSVSSEVDTSSGVKGKYWKVVSTELNVRSGPGIKFPIIRKIRRDREVTEISKEGIWIQIGHQEFVSSRFLKRLVKSEN